MRTALLIAALVLVACREQPRAADDGGGATAEGPSPAPSTQGGWAFRSEPASASLTLEDRAGRPMLRLLCPRGRRLAVNVPGFTPLGSEDRLSFGAGGESVALVADSRGDSALGGVSAEGELPGNLEALLSASLSASYGAQGSGPHQPPGEEARNAFVAACTGGKAPRRARPEPARPHPCRVQDGAALPPLAMRAIGTEPFWGARIEGRCVSYSHPDDQAGTRVWTRFEGNARSGRWSGTLGGQPFRLRSREQAGCSDGMSDRRYPIAVELTVGGEERRGCAEPL